MSHRSEYEWQQAYRTIEDQLAAAQRRLGEAATHLRRMSQLLGHPNMCDCERCKWIRSLASGSSTGEAALSSIVTEPLDRETLRIRREQINPTPRLPEDEPAAPELAPAPEHDAMCACSHRSSRHGQCHSGQVCMDCRCISFRYVPEPAAPASAQGTGEPTYNHTRADSPRTPCEECVRSAYATDPRSLLAVVFDRLDELEQELRETNSSIDSKPTSDDLEALDKRVEALEARQDKTEALGGPNWSVGREAEAFVTGHRAPPQPAPVEQRARESSAALRGVAKTHIAEGDGERHREPAPFPGMQGEVSAPVVRHAFRCWWIERKGRPHTWTDRRSDTPTNCDNQNCGCLDCDESLNDPVHGQSPSAAIHDVGDK